MPGEIELVEEPYIRASTIVPKDYVGSVMSLNNERRGRFHHMEYLSEERVLLAYDLLLAEIVYDYYDRLEPHARLRQLRLRRDRLRARRPRAPGRYNGDPVDALSLIVHKARCRRRGTRARRPAARGDLRQMFDVLVQAAIGSRIVARETIKARRKDVLAKCYGGDITRKRKLLERQEEGEKEAHEAGRPVEVPQEAFLAVLNLDGDRNERRRQTSLRPPVLLCEPVRILRLRHDRRPARGSRCLRRCVARRARPRARASGSRA